MNVFWRAFKRCRATYALGCCLSALQFVALPALGVEVQTEELILEAVRGDDRGRLLARLAQEHRRTDPQLSMSYAEEAAVLLEESYDIQSLAMVRDVQAWHKLTQGHYDEALALSDEAMELAGAVAPDELAGQMYYTRGAIDLTRGSVNLAVQDFKKAIDHLKNTDDKASLARAHSALGGCYRHLSDFETAMTWHHKAYEIAMQTDDLDVQSTVFNNLGDLYDYMGQPDKALEYYRRSLDLEQAEEFGLVVKNLNVGTQYMELGEFEEALASYNLALALNRKMKLGQHEPEILIAMASAYLEMENYSQALHWSEEALTSAERSQVDVQLIGALNIRSQTYVAMADYASAVSVAEEAELMAARQEAPLLHIEALQQLAVAYKAAGQFQSALETLERYNTANEKLLTDKARLQLAQVQTSMEAEVAEQEIVRLQQEHLIQDLELRQQQSVRTIWISQILILILVIAFLVSRYLIVRRASHTDELTQIANRSYMSARLEQEFKRFQRYRNPCCVMIMDIDDFKEVNDVHGHECGDVILSKVARLVGNNVRNTDRVARWGGEEFVVLFPQTELPEAQLVAERVRQAIEGHRFKSAASKIVDADRLQVRVTGGIAALEGSDLDVQAWLKRADNILYEGKQAGKNRVLIASSEAEPDITEGTVQFLNETPQSAAS